MQFFLMLIRSPKISFRYAIFYSLLNSKPWEYLCVCNNFDCNGSGNISSTTNKYADVLSQLDQVASEGVSPATPKDNQYLSVLLGVSPTTPKVNSFIGYAGHFKLLLAMAEKFFKLKLQRCWQPRKGFHHPPRGTISTLV